jgi:acyl-coenzyme A thioesterase PaaI-like protein
MLKALGKIDFAGAGATLRRLWQALRPIPGGRLLFGRIVGLINPYTGSLGARFLELGPGHARFELRQRRAIQNHVGSIHAIALMNLAEVTSGLALMFGLSDETRGLPVGLSIEYHKKARGTVTAVCDCTPPSSNEPQQIELDCFIDNAAGERVATARARWAIGPKPR